MHETRQAVLDELQYYFVVKQEFPDGTYQLALSSYAPFRDDRTTTCFDREEDAALFLLDEFRKGAMVSSNDVETAKAILRGEQPMFLYEEKQADGSIVLSLHDRLSPEESGIATFGSRSAKILARLLLRRLHESERIRASEATIRQARELMG
ncbi:MAG TPA: hypothetical protein VIZ18_07720 [Ktedonobacteraceae bacterium]